MNQCEKMGIYTALDDFGSGYSSLRMLLQYPCSIIKLDRSLVGEAIETEAKLNFTGVLCLPVISLAKPSV